MISGVQQVGIGVSDVHKAWALYRKAFGMNVPVFEEDSEANLMLPYTGNQPQSRHAVLALNMNGGAGFEIWQYSSREPQAPPRELRLGDLGIFITKLGTEDIDAAHRHLAALAEMELTEIQQQDDGRKHFLVRDPWGNRFQIIEFDYFFGKMNFPISGAIGAMIGVSDLKKSKEYYRNLLGFKKLLFEGEGERKDLNSLPGATRNMKFASLRRDAHFKGAFSELLGPAELELIEVPGAEQMKIYKDRFWGDLGFIHLCFDVLDLKAMREKCIEMGYPFTVDSGDSFDMGEAAGHFAYIEDPDGCLIEMVETHKIPIMKKIGWYLNLKKRNPEKPLPKWMIKLLSLNKKRN